MPPLFGRSIEHRQRDSLTTQVLRDLSGRIEKGELKPGDRLPTERELMALYGVSRTVVREAVSSLRSTGRIATQQGRGAWVLTCYGICGLALFGVLAYFFSDFIAH